LVGIAKSIKLAERGAPLLFFMKIFVGFLALLPVALLPANPILPAALPKPAGLKAVIETRQTAIYSVPKPKEAVRTEAVKIFTDAGWLPYGEAGETRYFKRGKVKALLTVSSAPNDTGKSMVTYMAETMSADLPAPPGATDIQYSETTKRLSFFSTQTPDQIDAAYRKLVEPAGWATTMKKPATTDLDYVVIYRHPTEGMIRLEMRPGPEKVLATVIYSTLQDVQAEEARAKAQGDALRKKLAAQAAAANPEVHLTVPKGTSKHFATKGGYALVMAPGTAMEGAKKISAELQQQGWKPGADLPLARETGMIELSRDNLRASIVFMDPGGIPAEITLLAPDVSIKVKP
jgi:hypothetical protein